MDPSQERKRAFEPRTTRANSDWIMIALGVFLILCFLAAGYWASRDGGRNAAPRNRGPVKDPAKLGFLGEGAAAHYFICQTPHEV